MKLAALVLGVGLSVAAIAATRPAHAFEREWHLGAGAGVTNGNGLSLSPAVSAYAAYGLSDVFDARLELTARGYHIGSEQNPNALSAMAGLAYKLDVLRWVPWGAVYAGYLQFLDTPRTDLVFKQRDFALGLGVGLDYAFSRDWGAGVTVRFDDALADSSASSFDAFLRAEYRWGW
jgi:outer membrane scaffolding protein for murein synthesis (MipA/OmpV family)